MVHGLSCWQSDDAENKTAMACAGNNKIIVSQWNTNTEKYQIAGHHVHLCQITANTAWSHMAGDALYLCDGFPNKSYYITFTFFTYTTLVPRQKALTASSGAASATVAAWYVCFVVAVSLPRSSCVCRRGGRCCWMFRRQIPVNPLRQTIQLLLHLLHSLPATNTS